MGTDTDTFYTIYKQIYTDQIMSDFEENFEIPAASEVDPAAEFLAKEQAELGDIGEDLGIAPAAGQETLQLSPDISQPEAAAEITTGMSQMYVAKEQQERLRKKDDEESAAKEELKQKAKQELEDWYKRYETQIEKTKSSNREEETKYEGNEMNHIEPGSEWERVAKHCDFSAKAPGHSKDVSRLRSIM